MKDAATPELETSDTSAFLDPATEAELAKAIPYLEKARALVIANATDGANAFPLDIAAPDFTRLGRSIVAIGLQTPPAFNYSPAAIRRNSTLARKITRGRRRAVWMVALACAEYGEEEGLEICYASNGNEVWSPRTFAEYLEENGNHTRREMTPQSMGVVLAKLYTLAHAAYVSNKSLHPFKTVPKISDKAWCKLHGTNPDYVRAALAELEKAAPEEIEAKAEAVAADVKTGTKNLRKRAPAKATKPAPQRKRGTVQGMRDLIASIDGMTPEGIPTTKTKVLAEPDNETDDADHIGQVDKACAGCVAKLVGEAVAALQELADTDLNLDQRQLVRRVLEPLESLREHAAEAIAKAS